MSSGGPKTPRLNFKDLIVADAEKIEFDLLNDRLELLREAWIDQREPGESYNSWFNRTSKDPENQFVRLLRFREKFI